MLSRRWFLWGAFAVAVTFPMVLRPASVLSIAHRGNSLYAPENTLAAFLAAEGKADLVECDVYVSRDGHLVVLHDATVNRTTDGSGAVADLTLAEIKLLDAGSWFGPAFAGERIPTLEEMVTNTVPFAVPLIERKAGPAALYVEELRRLDAVTNVELQSFDWNFLAAVHALEPGLRLGALGSGTLTTASLASIQNSGCSIVGWAKAGVTPAVVSMVHDAGLDLYVWTVDGPAEIQAFADMGVDGIISNDPATVKGLQPPTTNAPTHLGDRLIAYWNMDDGLADDFTTTVADPWGGNTATLTRNDGASHWFGPGIAQLGGCLKLEGASAFVTVPPTEALDIHTNALSLSVWVQFPQLPSQLATSYGPIYDSTTDCYVLYLDRSNKELRFKVTDANGHAARPGIPEVFLRTNQWLHVAATYDGAAAPSSGRTTIYLDGQKQDVHTGSDSSPPIGLTAHVKAGQAAAMGRQGPTDANYFTGFVDDLALWKRALTDSEVRQLFDAGQIGVSLGDLLPQHTPLIQFVSLQRAGGGSDLEIRFRNLGPWQTFHLLRSDSPAGTFQRVPSLSPEELGDGSYRFLYPITGSSSGYFRVEAE